MENEIILEQFNEEDLNKKHKHEKKELQSKIQSLKKSVPKGDKKKKKEITDEITNLELDLEKRHTEELELFRKNNPRIDENDVDNQKNEDGQLNDSLDDNSELNDSGNIKESVASRVSRAQKRRNKKAAEEKEREKRISEQAERNKGGPREMEMKSIKEVLRRMNLHIHNIPADGNCLYCAVNHQLEVKGKKTYSIKELRKITADFMLKNQDDFLPFMCNDDDDETVSEEEFRTYCNNVATTKLWGGQLELKALSNILSCPIKIIQSNGPPTVQGEGFEGPELILTYHRHLYRLGEHYNSTIFGTKNENDDDDDVC